MGRLNRVTSTVLFISTPDQLGRKQIYYYKRILIAYCLNIYYTVVTLPSCLRRLLNQKTTGWTETISFAVFELLTAYFHKKTILNSEYLTNFLTHQVSLSCLFVYFFFVKTISFNMKLVKIRNWRFVKVWVGHLNSYL